MRNAALWLGITMAAAVGMTSVAGQAAAKEKYKFYLSMSYVGNEG